MLCRECGHSEYDHQAGQNCPVGGTMYHPAGRYAENYIKLFTEARKLGYKEAVIREFETGATRDLDDNKLDYEGFLSPVVLQRYAEYMHKNRVQKDGSLRAADNWQKGIPKDAYMKSMWRHFHAVWAGHRGGTVSEEDLCALMFNVMGYLFEELRSK